MAESGLAETQRRGVGGAIKSTENLERRCGARETPEPIVLRGTYGKDRDDHGRLLTVVDGRLLKPNEIR